MQRDINLIIEETKLNIVKTINKSGLPISVIYYIMRDIMTETSEEYQRQINRAYTKEREQQEQAASAEPINTEEITEIVEDN